MNIKQSTVLALLAAGLCCPIAGLGADQAMDLLEKMRTAVHDLNYSGTLVYLQDNELSTYQVSHQLQGGAEKESVIRLSQSEGYPSGEVESFSLNKLQRLQPQAEQVYAFDLGGEDWVANRACRVVVARPRDHLRYLQRYCIDPASGMLMKYALIDRSHQPVEQLMFTQLDIQDQAKQPKAESEALRMLGPQAAAPVPQLASAAKMKSLPTVHEEDDLPARVEKSANGWKFETLPPGFQQTRTLLEDEEDGQPPVQQIILSDGMTAVSVFISTRDDVKGLDDVEDSSGAMNILTRKLDGHTVTLIGEVPVATLQRMSVGLKHVR